MILSDHERPRDLLFDVPANHQRRLRFEIPGTYNLEYWGAPCRRYWYTWSTETLLATILECARVQPTCHGLDFESQQPVSKTSMVSRLYIQHVSLTVIAC